MTGHGYPAGPARTDWPEGYYDLACDTCQASWVGPEGDPCEWCQTSLDHMRLWQAELTLTPPDTDPDDITRPDALKAWQNRLTVAITAGIITNQQAERAWDRATT